jgi:hypothetical protein
MVRKKKKGASDEAIHIFCGQNSRIKDKPKEGGGKCQELFGGVGLTTGSVPWRHGEVDVVDARRIERTSHGGPSFQARVYQAPEYLSDSDLPADRIWMEIWRKLTVAVDKKHALGEGC